MIAFVAANPAAAAALEALRTVTIVGEVAAATGGALLSEVCVALSAVQGDSSPRQLQGINRFAPRASVAGLQDGDPAASDASPVGPAPVDLPGEPTASLTSAVDAMSPIDWAALAASDPIAFCKLAHQYIDGVKEEVLRRLERGETLQSIDDWFQSEVRPKLNSLLDVLGNNRKSFRSLVQVFDVFVQRALIFRNKFEDALEDSDPAALGKLCCMDPQVVKNFMIRLHLMVIDTVDIHIQGLRDDDEIDPAQVEPLFQRLADIMRDVADHAKPDERPGVVIRQDGDHLIINTGKEGGKRVLLDFPVL